MPEWFPDVFIDSIKNRRLTQIMRHAYPIEQYIQLSWDTARVQYMCGMPSLAIAPETTTNQSIDKLYYVWTLQKNVKSNTGYRLQRHVFISYHNVICFILSVIETYMYIIYIYIYNYI